MTRYHVHPPRPITLADGTAAMAEVVKERFVLVRIGGDLYPVKGRWL